MPARRYEQYGVGSEVPTIRPRHWYSNVVNVRHSRHRVHEWPDNGRISAPRIILLHLPLDQGPVSLRTAVFAHSTRHT